MITVLRKAEPGAIMKKKTQPLRGICTRTGDRLNISQSPHISIASSNVKSTACLRVSSIIIGRSRYARHLLRGGTIRNSNNTQTSVVGCFGSRLWDSTEQWGDNNPQRQQTKQDGSINQEGSS